MQIDYDFKAVSKFNESTMVCLCQIITQTVGPLGLLKEKTSEQFLMEFFQLEEEELDMVFSPGWHRHSTCICLTRIPDSMKRRWLRSYATSTDV